MKKVGESVGSDDKIGIFQHTKTKRVYYPLNVFFSKEKKRKAVGFRTQW